MSDPLMVLLNLRLIAAKAAKLATDLERGRIYPDDVTRGLDEIALALADARANEGGR